MTFHVYFLKIKDTTSAIKESLVGTLANANTVAFDIYNSENTTDSRKSSFVLD